MNNNNNNNMENKVEFKSVVYSKKHSATECVVTIPHIPNVTLGTILVAECDRTRYFRVESITLEYDTVIEIGYWAILLKRQTLENAIEVLKDAKFRLATGDEQGIANEENCWC